MKDYSRERFIVCIYLFNQYWAILIKNLFSSKMFDPLLHTI